MFATFNGFIVSLEKTGEKQYGVPIYRYQVITPEPYVIFQGEHFKPSIAAVRNDLLLPLEILQWICLEYETNDHSLFDHYTKEQLEFANSDDIATFSYIVDDAWENIDLKNYMFLLNESNVQIITISDIHSPLVIMKDKITAKEFLLSIAGKFNSGESKQLTQC